MRMPPGAPCSPSPTTSCSPVAPIASHVLFVKEARLGHFRSQVPAMVLCQTLVMSLGYRNPEAAAETSPRGRK